MELKGSRTEQNLLTAFAGESQARNKYTYYASVAKKEGYEQIAEIFLETAGNEKEHAELWFKALHETRFLIQKQTYSMQQKAKIMNGQKCMKNSLKLLMKKALQQSLNK